MLFTGVFGTNNDTVNVWQTCCVLTSKAQRPADAEGCPEYVITATTPITTETRPATISIAPTTTERLEMLNLDEDMVTMSLAIE